MMVTSEHEDSVMITEDESTWAAYKMLFMWLHMWL